MYVCLLRFLYFENFNCGERQRQRQGESLLGGGCFPHKLLCVVLFIKKKRENKIVEEGEARENVDARLLCILMKQKKNIERGFVENLC